MNKKLLKNVRINGVGELQSVLIDGEYIVAVESSAVGIPEDGVEVVDFHGRMAVPSLINIHTHLDKSGLSGRVVNETGSIWEARKKLLECKKTLTVDDIKQRAGNTILASIENGVTAIRTHVDVDPIIGLKGIQAMLELKEEMQDLITLQIVAFPQEGISEAPGTFALMEEALQMGADVVGGHLSIARDFYEHSARVFDLAEKYGKDVDIHVDYDINRDYEDTSIHADGLEYPNQLGIVAMCEEKIKRGFPGRVTASHLCGLDSVRPDMVKNIVELMERAQIAVVALPPNNMYCNGRDDLFNTRRGVTKVKTLLENDVLVSFGPDNIKDPFNPLGTSNMIQNAVLTAYACHMASAADYSQLFQMMTLRAAEIMGLEQYGIEVSNRADITIVDAKSPEEALAENAGIKALFRGGRLLVMKEQN